MVSCCQGRVQALSAWPAQRSTTNSPSTVAANVAPTSPYSVKLRSKASRTLAKRSSQKPWMSIVLPPYLTRTQVGDCSHRRPTSGGYNGFRRHRGSYDEGFRRQDRGRDRWRHGHGPGARATAHHRGVPRGDLRHHRGEPRGDRRVGERRGGARCAGDERAVRRRGRGRGHRVPRPRPRRVRDRAHQPALQQRRHRRWRQLHRRQSRRMGAHVQHLLVRRLLHGPRLPRDAHRER